MERLIAEWLAERTRFIGSLIGLTDEQFNAETARGQWTYRVLAKHVLALEQDSLKTLAGDMAARTSGGGAQQTEHPVAPAAWPSSPPPRMEKTAGSEWRRRTRKRLPPRR